MSVYVIVLYNKNGGHSSVFIKQTRKNEKLKQSLIVGWAIVLETTTKKTMEWPSFVCNMMKNKNHRDSLEIRKTPLL